MEAGRIIKFGFYLKDTLKREVSPLEKLLIPIPIFEPVDLCKRRRNSNETFAADRQGLLSTGYLQIKVMKRSCGPADAISPLVFKRHSLYA